MRANELRIGNIIRFSEDGAIFTIDSIEQQGLSVQNEKEIAWINLDEFEPIPLTEDWLLKFGLEKQGLNKFWKNPLFLHFRVENCVFIVNEKYVYLSHVHQLQNLYFALTGEELTYTQHLKCTCSYESQYRNCAKQCERDSN
jgi:hypothetical protein